MAKGYKPVTTSKYALTNLIREEMFVKKRKGSAVSIFVSLRRRGTRQSREMTKQLMLCTPLLLKMKHLNIFVTDIGVLAGVRRRNDSFL